MTDRDPTGMSMQDRLTRIIAGRSGHFRYESGHHGDLWFDLEVLCKRPRAVQPLAGELARRLSAHNIEAVCGPLVEGSFIALMVAAELDVEFAYAERVDHPEREELYPVEYRIPDALRAGLRGRRVAIVNDVINAGSAVGGTFGDLLRCGAEPIAIGALLVLGDWTSAFAEENDLDVICISHRPNRLWAPMDCPLCSKGVPLEDVLTGQH